MPGGPGRESSIGRVMLGPGEYGRGKADLQRYAGSFKAQIYILNPFPIFPSAGPACLQDLQLRPGHEHHQGQERRDEVERQPGGPGQDLEGAAGQQ